MVDVFDRLVGQRDVVDELRAAASGALTAARRLAERPSGTGSMLSVDAGQSGDLAAADRASMTHSWLFTGPPGSGRSVAAECFAAALQCHSEAGLGCGECRACATVMNRTHADVRHVVPQGLSLGAAEVRELVQTAARLPATGRWHIIVVEDADRLTEAAANALLKVVEEPPARTVFLLCAPSVDPEDISVTLKSRCRHVALAIAPTADIERVLVERDGVDPANAAWAASVCGGHIGRAKRLATDQGAREQRLTALGLARAATVPARAYAAAEELVHSAEAAAKAISAERDARELEELMTAFGAGGTGRGTARVMRGSAGAIKDLEKRQKSRATRTARDVLDLALMDLAGLFRDALVVSAGARVTAMHPDQADQVIGLAGYASSAQLLTCVDAVLECREVLDHNVKPKFALDAMVAKIGQSLARGGA
ncbi:MULTISPECIES: DNA polymerase III subunit delta' [Gordonia]|uniref:DNA polymerase III subunit delta' n=1 Tax=Gordonia TaxID=2053 RepID=UPI0025C0F2C8|nr:DNA polymerase III subunit delta' [Gordonia sp. UBA5067]